MPTEYIEATEARIMAAKMIPKEHSHLNGVDVIFVFVRKLDKDGVPQMWESSGEPVIGKVTKKSGLDAYLYQQLTSDGELEDFFVIQIDQYAWRSTNEETRPAILDHLLCFCEIETTDSGDTQLKVRKEVVRGFVENIRRHGLWQNTFKKFVEVGAKQLPLLPEPEKADGATKKKATKADKSKVATIEH